MINTTCAIFNLLKLDIKIALNLQIIDDSGIFKMLTYTFYSLEVWQVGASNKD